MPITEDTLRLLDDLRDRLDDALGAQAADLARAWADAWSEVAPDLRETLSDMLVAGERVTRGQLLRSERLRGVLLVITDRLEQLTEQAGVRVTGDLRHIIDTAGAAQASVIDSQLPPGFISPDELAAWSRVDPEQVAAIVQRTTEQITSLLRPLSAEASTAVRLELIRGVSAGSNPRATARRIMARTEGRFNGGYHRAVNIARTEQLDAFRAASDLGQAQHADVLAGWVWTASLSERTCPSCWAQHGTVHALSEPGPLDHQSGRCTRVPKTRSWADLGFDGIEEPPDLLPDAEQQFTALDTDTQLQILGPSRHAAWQAGDYPMSDWSQRRSSDGWRDSYAVSPAPSGGRSLRVAS